MDCSIDVVHLGLPDLQYVVGDLVFQPPSPASQKKATAESVSPVFDSGDIVIHKTSCKMTVFSCTLVIFAGIVYV